MVVKKPTRRIVKHVVYRSMRLFPSFSSESTAFAVLPQKLLSWKLHNQFFMPKSHTHPPFKTLLKTFLFKNNKFARSFHSFLILLESSSICFHNLAIVLSLKCDNFTQNEACPHDTIIVKRMFKRLIDNP